MNILGIINKDKTRIYLDKKKIDLKELFVYFKGDIFNKESLLKKYKLKLKNDEELIKYLYKHEKTSFLKKLDGDFLIVIYDKPKLYLITDKLCNKHLYYYHKDNNFIFSTSLKQIIKDKNFVKEFNKEAIANYLGYDNFSDEQTLFKNTFKLNGGTYLTYYQNKVTIKKYFDLVEEYKNSKIEKLTEEEYIKKYEKQFKECLLKLGKPKSIGILMSSGKDSTLLAHLAKKYFKCKINTYTLGFENERDESKPAAKIAKCLKTNHHTIMLKDKDVKKTIAKIPYYYEEPFADPSNIPTIYLIEHIKEKNDFYISGDAVDTIFMNENQNQIYSFKMYIKLFFKKLINIRCRKRVYHNFSEKSQLNIVSRFNYSDKLLEVKGQVFELEKVNNPKIRTMIGDVKHLLPFKYKMKTASVINKNGFKYYMPFYDVNLIKLIFKTPLKYVEKKYISNKILYKNIDKKLFATYQKNGFGVPLVNWVKRFMLDDIKKISTKKYIAEQNIFNFEELDKLIKEFETDLDYNRAVVLYNYYMFQLWYKANL